MQGKPVLPQFGDVLNKLGEIKTNAKFESNTPYIAKQKKTNNIIKSKKKALDVLADKLILKSSNTVIKKSLKSMIISS